MMTPVQPSSTAVLDSATAAASPPVIATMSPLTTTTGASTLLRDKIGDSGPAGREFFDEGLQQLVRSSCLLRQRRARAPGTPLVNSARKQMTTTPPHCNQESHRHQKIGMPHNWQNSHCFRWRRATKLFFSRHAHWNCQQGRFCLKTSSGW